MVVSEEEEFVVVVVQVVVGEALVAERWWYERGEMSLDRLRGSFTLASGSWFTREAEEEEEGDCCK